MRIAVIGTGRMGSWLAKELTHENEVFVYDVDLERAKSIEGVKVFDEASKLVEINPELLINAVSLQNTICTFEKVVGYLPKECLICDVASVKKDLPSFYEKCNRRFVSVHPMFGPTFANLDELKEENVVIIKESDSQGAEFFKRFFGNLGVKIFEYTFQEHDHMMAYSLTTPFSASLVFAACVDNTTVPGTTFAKHRAIAKKLLSEDDQLLAEILFNPLSIQQLDKITGRLEFLKHIIRAKDFEEAKKFFDGLRKNID